MGEGETIDGDDPAHIKWIHDKALARAEEYGIQGVNYRLTQGKIWKLRGHVGNLVCTVNWNFILPSPDCLCKTASWYYGVSSFARIEFDG